MTTYTPVLGAAELAPSQAIPETTVNEIVRLLEQGALAFAVKDKDLNAPPGSPAEGDAYIVAAGPTGAWTGEANSIAFYQAGTGWRFITPREGMRADVADEDIAYRYDGAAWSVTGSGAVEASDAEIWTGTDASKAITPRRLISAAVSQALTDGPTITPDFNAGFNFHVTLGGNRTLANPTNVKAGQAGRIRITQDATGSRTLAFGSNWLFPGGDPTLSTAANSIDVIAYYCHSATEIEASCIKALA